MFDLSRFPQADAVRKAVKLSADDYQRLYRQSVEQPDQFWADQANTFLDWSAPWSAVQQADIKTGDAQWFKGGKLNVSYNCIDRHLKERGEQTAIIWEGDDPSDSQKIT